MGELRTRIAVLPAQSGPFEVHDGTLSPPGPHQVVVHQYAAGICHSNLPRMYGERPQPAFGGHESTGVVVARGQAVRRFREGDRVIVTWVPRFPAGRDRRRDSITVRIDGGDEITTPGLFTWSDSIVVDEQFLVPLPENTDAIVTSILGCAVITGAGGVLRSVSVKPGQSVAIFGVGGVGLCAVAAAAALHASRIIAVDLDDEKLALARSFGATDVVNARDADPVTAIRELTPDPVLTDATGQPVAGVDYAFDCVGAPATMVQIFQAARSMALGRTSGGTAVLIGVPLTPLTLDPMDFHMNEKKYRGSLAGTCRPDRDIPVFLEWYRSGRLDLDRLVTRRFSLEQVAEAVEALEAGQILGRSVFVFEQPAV